MFKEKLFSAAVGALAVTAPHLAIAAEKPAIQCSPGKAGQVATRLNELVGLIQLEAVKAVSEDVHVDEAGKERLKKTFAQRASDVQIGNSSPELTTDGVLICMPESNASPTPGEVAVCIVNQTLADKARVATGLNCQQEQQRNEHMVDLLGTVHQMLQGRVSVDRVVFAHQLFLSRTARLQPQKTTQVFPAPESAPANTNIDFNSM